MTATQSHRRPPGGALPRRGALNKSDIIRAIEDDFKKLREGEVTPTPYPEPEAVVNIVLGTIKLGLRSGEAVSIRNFGKFEPRVRSAVVRKNPKSGEPIDVPEKWSVGFVPAPALKEEINAAREDW